MKHFYYSFAGPEGLGGGTISGADDLFHPEQIQYEVKEAVILSFQEVSVEQAKVMATWIAEQKRKQREGGGCYRG